VHSSTQQNLEKGETECITTSLQSEFRSMSWPDLRNSFLALSKPVAWTIHTWLFLVLDEQSIHDRKVVLTIRGREWYTEEGGLWESYPVMRKGLTEYTTWKKYRVPFEEVCDCISLLNAKGGLKGAEPELQEVVREKIVK
jgi:hypothetical protein